MPGEVPGPGPEETGAEAPEVPAPTPTEETRRPASPSQGGRRWYWPFGGRQEATQPSPPPESTPPREELEAARAEVEAERRRVERMVGAPSGGLERIKELAASTDPEDLVHLMTIVSAEQFREMKLEEKHPGRLGRLRQILAAERDFSVDEDGKVRHEAWQELSRKALTTIFNKKTLLMAGTLGVAGVLTGGLAYPVAAALFGSIGGRGLAEGLEYLYGHERGRRQKIVEAQVAQWSQLHEMALKASAEDIDPAEKARLYTEIINGFHLSSEQMIAAEERLGETKAMWNRRREIFSAIGAGVGALGGLWAGLKGLTDLGIFNLDGDKTLHAVRSINNVWHFAYNNATEIAQAKAFAAAHNYPLTIVQGLYHQVGAGSEAILARTGAQIAMVFGTLGLVSALERKKGDKMGEILTEEQEERRQAMLGKIPAVPEAPSPEPTPEEALVSNQERYQALAAERHLETMPAAGQFWLYEDVGGRGYLRIINIDWSSGQVLFEKLDQTFQPVPTGEKEPGRYQFSIENLLSKGREIVEDWLIGVKDGDELTVPAEKIVDRSEPRAKKIAAGNYKFKRMEKKPGQAELAKEGARKPIVDILDLALAGVRPIEKEKEKKPAKMPKQNEIWALKRGAELPDGLVNRVIIADVEDNVLYLLDAANNQPIETTIEDINGFVNAFRKIGKKGGGGGGGQRQQRRNE